MVVPPVVNAPIKLDFDSWNGEVFSKLPDFIKDKIKTSAEYKAKFSDDEQSEIPF
jgi:hypothetical protein